MEVPIACSLTDSDARAQLGEWRTAMAAAVAATDRRSPTELCLRLRADLGGLADLVRLAQRERACCPFFDFTLQIKATEIALVISVPPDASGVLDMFGELAASSAAACGLGELTIA